MESATAPEFDLMALITGTAPADEAWETEYAARERARLEKEQRDLDAICPKCNGRGRISAYHYHQDGLCFACNGFGVRWGRAG